jgi:ABC-2 type transport system permease protein
LIRSILFMKRKSIKAQLQYPLNMVISVGGMSLIGILDILLLLIPVNTFQSIGGWGFWELGFMFSLWKMSHGIHQFLFLPFWNHDNLVITGEYDRMLVRPVHPILQILVNDFSPAAIAEWLPSITMFILASPHTKISWNFLTIVFLITILLSGAIIEWAVSLFIASFSFWFSRTRNLRGIAHTFLFRVSHYPAHIYRRFFPFILTFIFPYAFMAYYPTHYFFNIKAEIYYWFFPYLPPLVAVLSLSLALAFWSLGLRNYNSSGT